MESILLIGGCSVVDVLGNMLASCTCFDKNTTEGFWGKGPIAETDNASVVPVCDDSSPSSDSSQMRRNVRFSQTSTNNISIFYKSTSPDSVTTTSTSSTISINGNRVASDHLDISRSLPTKMKTFGSSSSEEFAEIEITTSSYNPNRSRREIIPSPQQKLQQQQQLKDRQAQRHRSLGHTKRKLRVRKLLAEDIAHRQRRLETKLDRERHEVTEWKTGC